MGACQGTRKSGCSARGRRPRPRTCLRKGCGRQYLPRRWNQRYCREPECLRQVRQWQAARRQARHRQAAEAKAQHAQAEKARRQRVKAASQTIENSKVAPPRGHAAESFFRPRYAIGRAATSTPQVRLATRRGTVALLAVRQFAMSRIENASGSLAAPWTDARSGATSTTPHAGTGFCDGVTSLLRCRHVLLHSDDPSGSRRSSIIAWLLVG
jgi:hypothetical protein